jgi:hypothetical protein
MKSMYSVTVWSPEPTRIAPLSSSIVTAAVSPFADVGACAGAVDCDHDDDRDDHREETAVLGCCCHGRFSGSGIGEGTPRPSLPSENEQAVCVS